MERVRTDTSDEGGCGGSLRARADIFIIADGDCWLLEHEIKDLSVAAQELVSACSHHEVKHQPEDEADWIGWEPELLESPTIWSRGGGCVVGCFDRRRPVISMNHHPKTMRKKIVERSRSDPMDPLAIRSIRFTLRDLSHTRDAPGIEA
jgi:hypothetical protein